MKPYSCCRWNCTSVLSPYGMFLALILVALFSLSAHILSNFVLSFGHNAELAGRGPAASSHFTLNWPPIPASRVSNHSNRQPRRSPHRRRASPRHLSRGARVFTSAATDPSVHLSKPTRLLHTSDTSPASTLRTSSPRPPLTVTPSRNVSPVLRLTSNTSSTLLPANSSANLSSFSAQQPERMRASSRNERVICFLTKRSGLDDLKRSLHFLFANFNDRFGYPVLVFHTGDLPHELLDREMAGTLNERQRALLEAHEVKDFMEFPPGYDQKLGPIPNPFYTSRYPGYHQMCAFWFRKVFLQPRMRHVEYYWRFDTDSYLLSDVRYDVFGFAARHNITYGYRARFIETCCAEYMTKFLHMYIDARHLHALVSDELSWVLRQTNATWASGPFRNPPGNLLGVFYNNFEIVHVPSFRDSPLVWDFVESTWRDTILGEYGIYRYRWGDGTLRFQTVYLFPHLYRATHMFCDLHYVHQDRFVASCDFSDSRRDRWPVENQPRTSEFLDLCRAAQHRAPVNCARVVPDWTCPKNFRYA